MKAYDGGSKVFYSVARSKTKSKSFACEMLKAGLFTFTNEDMVSSKFSYKNMLVHGLDQVTAG